MNACLPQAKRVFAVAGILAVATVPSAPAWESLPINQDPLVRMPGSQQNSASIEGPGRCFNCHDGYDPAVEPGSHWAGSMMGQAARDPIFFACMVVAGQDSIWAIGRPNAMDLCLRCHFPHGWVEGRSDPPNASLMTGDDYDGIHCNVCHQMIDPFYEDTYLGVREGNDWLGYWDETGTSSRPSQPRADVTRGEDIAVSLGMSYFNGSAFYGLDHRPASSGYTENGGGQFFLSHNGMKRASFADDTARHSTLYSRYHKSKYFCGTCHDVSNPVLANLAFEGTPPGVGTNALPAESQSAFAYAHVERTFSEFMLSHFSQAGGAAGTGEFAPTRLVTSLPGNHIGRCQDCHLPDRAGAASKMADSPVRPSGSPEHPKSGVPVHGMAGGNLLVPRLLASIVPESPNYDPTNQQLLTLGADQLTLDFSHGVPLNPDALLRASDWAHTNLLQAATLTNLVYDPFTGECSFRIVNHTGHKLISGFPEGRRMYVNLRLYCGADALIFEVNPYDRTVGTLSGVPGGEAALGFAQAHVNELVYEVKPSSSLTGEDKTFHFVLADGRYKDNRIPPAGFRIEEAVARMCEPVWAGNSDTNFFAPAEYQGGFDSVQLILPIGGDRVEATLYYQTTSREYIAFLRDEINGTASTLPPDAYRVQSDPYFAAMKAWGDVIWQLWDHNKNQPGAAPVAMTTTAYALDRSDADGDGLPAFWEQHYFGGPTHADPDADPDQDGSRNLSEFTFFTHPLQPDVVITSLVVNEPDVSGVTFDAHYSREYGLQFAPRLASEAWVDRMGWQPGDDSAWTLLVTNQTSRGYFRVKVALPGQSPISP